MSDDHRKPDGAFEPEDHDSVIPPGLLPGYMADAFGDLYEEDGLICFGRGLQWMMLLASFCRYYAEDGLQPDPNGEEPETKGNIVLVLGLKDEGERSTLVQVLQSWGTPIAQLPIMITNENHTKDRTSLYAQGGIFCITSRILIVDLLTNTISPKDIAGMLVAHADQVTDQSTEAFILRIFQSQKQQIQQQQGFVKAFSDAPDSLTNAFAKVDKVLKALHVRKLYLYPRFHSSIRDELESGNHIVVTELHQALSKRQKEIQGAIAVLVMQCLRQLKQATEHLVSWSNEGQPLSVENCVTQQFDRAVSRQLEPYWHRLAPSTKQLVQDLRTLRTLFHALLQYDCVSFYKLLNSIRTMSAASRHPSMWLLEAGADALFRKAKDRVYVLHRPTPTTKVPKPVAQLEAVLEENPKWKLLKSVLSEIQEEDKKKNEEEDVDDNDGGVRNILVMVKDDKTLETIKSYLTEDGKGILQLRWLRYLEQCNDRSRSITDSRGGTSSISEESRLLLEEEGRARRILFGRNTSRRAGKQKRDDPSPQKLNQVPDYLRKRRRIAAEKGRGDRSKEDLDRQAVLEEAVETMQYDLDQEDGETKARAKNEKYDDDDVLFRVSYPDRELRIVIQSYNCIEGDQIHLLLQDMRPKYVVLYDVDVAFIRAVEIYAAISARSALRVYFLIFEASAEEKNFKKSLEREQNSFEKLIQHKITMPPPVLQSLETQEMQQALEQGGVAGTYMGGALPLSMDTRRGKGKKNTSKERRDVAVDVREFRSSLPSILHQGGMRLAPVTLIVGDFVLSSVHCVERKSISDLFGSFSSGRLYTQAEAMSKYYKCPCLLIEFDPNKSFCLQNSNELGVEIRNDSVCTKMALLVTHFPKLRILWSKSPHETLKIFRLLKTNHDEVDVAKAMEYGRSESEEFLLQQAAEGEEEDEINEVARDMLLRLPGVTVHSARKIMKECDSLAELSEMTREDLRRIAGPVTGQKLFTFFRQKMGAL